MKQTVCKGFRKHEFEWKSCENKKCEVDHMAAFYLGWMCGDKICKNCGTKIYE